MDLILGQRVLSRANQSGACWLWLGYVDQDGYGRVHWTATSEVLVHRIVYLTLVGEIPAELELDHTCNVRNCVRPSHLEPVTHAENQHRRIPRKTVCQRGHIFAEGNIVVLSSGRRTCLTCLRASEIRRGRRKAA